VCETSMACGEYSWVTGREVDATEGRVKTVQGTGDPNPLNVSAGSVPGNVGRGSC
jgi:hypothetical protein